MFQGDEFAGEEHERVFDGRDVQVLDASDHEGVVAGGVLGDNLALERREGIGEQRYSGASGRPVEAGESVGAGGGRACHEALVI